MPKLSEVQGICFVLFTSCIFALCSKTNKTISHCELKKGAHKSAVNCQRKEVCWLCWVSSCLLCVWQLRIPDLSPDQKSNGQITLPRASICVPFILHNCTWKESLSDFSSARSSDYTVSLVERWGNVSAMSHLRPLGLFCLVDRWLSARLSFRLKIRFMQNFQSGSIWLCVSVKLCKDSFGHPPP